MILTYLFLLSPPRPLSPLSFTPPSLRGCVKMHLTKCCLSFGCSALAVPEADEAIVARPKKIVRNSHEHIMHAVDHRKLKRARVACRDAERKEEATSCQMDAACSLVPSFSKLCASKRSVCVGRLPIQRLTPHHCKIRVRAIHLPSRDKTNLGVNRTLFCYNHVSEK